MAKADDKQLPSESPAVPKAVAQVYRDTLYTSRVLILPDGRTLAVVKGRVTAAAGDAVAQRYLGDHPDLELLTE
ncbi:hypothetical protein NVV94_08290 [Pseudomonas sp. LS1212]|uniref:hypothetical protein n=1 Tax=Pseudomonas sp. LS1212 TaxID=2972478 RepID=UPI00215B9C65|nr:hypothetical protein [Pseudomonas sp. LS1212]UVJ45542.1 hypothetical protein NVV94_08290 [Pseudomonas sp. LS1212]